MARSDAIVAIPRPERSVEVAQIIPGGDSEGMSELNGQFAQILELTNREFFSQMMYNQAIREGMKSLFANVEVWAMPQSLPRRAYAILHRLIKGVETSEESTDQGADVPTLKQRANICGFVTSLPDALDIASFFDEDTASELLSMLIDIRPDCTTSAREVADVCSNSLAEVAEAVDSRRGDALKYLTGSITSLARLCKASPTVAKELVAGSEARILGTCALARAALARHGAGAEDADELAVSLIRSAREEEGLYADALALAGDEIASKASEGGEGVDEGKLSQMKELLPGQGEEALRRAVNEASGNVELAVHLVLDGSVAPSRPPSTPSTSSGPGESQPSSNQQRKKQGGAHTKEGQAEKQRELSSKKSRAKASRESTASVMDGRRSDDLRLTSAKAKLFDEYNDEHDDTFDEFAEEGAASPALPGLTNDDVESGGSNAERTAQQSRSNQADPGLGRRKGRSNEFFLLDGKVYNHRPAWKSENAEKVKAQSAEEASEMARRRKAEEEGNIHGLGEGGNKAMAQQKQEAEEGAGEPASNGGGGRENGSRGRRGGGRGHSRGQQSCSRQEGGKGRGARGGKG